jgi:hypothetical protein
VSSDPSRGGPRLSRHFSFGEGHLFLCVNITCT